MKKSMVCGLMMSVSMFSIAAYADNDDNALTTKKYVNDGLEFVYKVANGVSPGAVKTLQETVSGRAADPENNIEATTGLVGDVAALQNTVNNATTGLVKRVTDLEATTGYTAGTGVVVTPGENDDPSTIGIAVPSNATNGTKYVFQSDGNGGGTWTKMEVADTWSSTFLTGGQ